MPDPFRPLPPQATRLLLLRHAETSAPDRFHGAESDVGLSDQGHSQAASVASTLATLAPSAVYSSDMKRARLTAQPIATASRLNLQTLPLLHERRMGPVSGQPIAEHRPLVLETFRLWSSGALHATHPGAESYLEIRDRVCPPVLELVRKHPGQTIVLVAHGVVIRVLLTSLPGTFPLSRFDQIPIRHVAINDLAFIAPEFIVQGIDLDSPLPQIHPPHASDPSSP